MAQRLVRNICNACRQPWNVDGIELPSDFPLESDAELYVGSGCEKCRQSGYSGREGIYELLVTSPAIQQLAVARASSLAVKNQAIQEGMTTLRHSGWQKVLQGRTTVDEVIRVTKDEEPVPPPKPTEKPTGSQFASSSERPIILALPNG